MQARGIATSIDVVSGEERLFQEKVLPALSYCDYAIMNEIEGCAASGLAPRDADGKLIVDNIVRTLELFMQRGVKRRAVLHCPEAGFCMDADAGLTIAPSFRLPRGYIKGSVGAGDAFCAGVAIGLTYGKALPEAIEIGSSLAASVISSSENVCPRFQPQELGLEIAR